MRYSAQMSDVAHWPLVCIMFTILVIVTDNHN